MSATRHSSRPSICSLQSLPPQKRAAGRTRGSVARRGRGENHAAVTEPRSKRKCRIEAEAVKLRTTRESNMYAAFEQPPRQPVEPRSLPEARSTFDETMFDDSWVFAVAFSTAERQCKGPPSEWPDTFIAERFLRRKGAADDDAVEE